MKRIMLIAPIVGALAIVAYATFAADTAPTNRPPRMGPPPEAMDACNGKAVGEKVSVTMADVRTIAGSVCRYSGPISRPIGRPVSKRDETNRSHDT